MLKKSADGRGNCRKPTSCAGPHCEGCSDFTLRDECIHGQLERSCPVCERDEEIADRDKAFAQLHEIIDEMICDCYDDYLKYNGLCNRCKALEVIKKFLPNS